MVAPLERPGSTISATAPALCDWWRLSPIFRGGGHGRKLAELVEAYARNRGIRRLFVNAAVDAVGYYEKLGWQCFSCDETELSGIAAGTVQMTKSLAW